MTFQEIGVNEQLASALNKKGLQEPTPIQSEVFPLVTEGKCLRILSKTGTGKTFAYVLPLVQRYLLEHIGKSAAECSIAILVVVPTRELAFQVSTSFETLGMQGKISVVVGGENEGEQIRKWKNCLVGIATPGRLLDLLDRKVIQTETLKALVFDEADRLIDMGFIDDIRRIYFKLPKNLQVLFASATMNLAVDEIGYEFGLQLERAGTEADELTAENLIHKIAYVGDEEKFHAIAAYVAEHKDSRGIVFSNFRERAHEIAKRLKGLGWAAEALSAQLNQDQRNAIIEDYRKGRTKVLVASDLASRGLDFLDIDYVINHDLPEDPAVYVHRVGRTARAGRKGEAISLIGFNDSFQLEKLNSFLGTPIPRYDFDHEKLSGVLPRKLREPNRERPEKRPARDRFESRKIASSMSDQRRNHSGPREQKKPSVSVVPSSSPKASIPVAKPGILQKLKSLFMSFFKAEEAVPVQRPDKVESAVEPSARKDRTRRERPHRGGRDRFQKRGRRPRGKRN